MSTTNMAVYQTTNGEVSLSISQIQQYLCPLATDEEAYMFLRLCQHQGLNPFLREAYLIKYDSKKPATMVTGKETFTQRAESHPAFDGMLAGIVVESRTGELDNRKGALIRSGETLIGGWAEVYRKDRQRPFRMEVSLAEYHTGQSSWNRIPATMIRKVALVQALREAFPTNFVGLYDASEMNTDLDRADRIIDAASGAQETTAGNHTKTTPSDIPEAAGLKPSRAELQQVVSDAEYYSIPLETVQAEIKALGFPRMQQMDREAFNSLVEWINRVGPKYQAMQNAEQGGGDGPEDTPDTPQKEMEEEAQLPFQ